MLEHVLGHGAAASVACALQRRSTSTRAFAAPPLRNERTHAPPARTAAAMTTMSRPDSWRNLPQDRGSRTPARWEPQLATISYTHTDPSRPSVTTGTRTAQHSTSGAKTSARTGALHDAGQKVLGRGFSPSFLRRSEGPRRPSQVGDDGVRHVDATARQRPLEPPIHSPVPQS